MARKDDDAGSISLAELGEHLGDLRRIHREALASDDDTPGISFANIRARCHGILGMLDRADAARAAASADDADPDDTAGDPINPLTGSSTGGDNQRGNDTLGYDSLSLAEVFGAETKAERMLKANEVFGGVRPEAAVKRLLDTTHIRNSELKSRKLKR
jgi:hypothetical protein